LVHLQGVPIPRNGKQPVILLRPYILRSAPAGGFFPCRQYEAFIIFLVSTLAIIMIQLSFLLSS